MPEKQSYFYGVISVDYQLTDAEKAEVLQRYPVPSLPDQNETFTLEKEEKGNSVAIRVLLNEVNVQTTRTNNQFLKMTFSNNAGPIQAKMWDNQGAVEKNLPLLEQYAVFDIKGVVDDYRGFKSINVHTIEPFTDEIDPFAYLPYTQQSIEDYTLELFAYLRELTPSYQAICYGLMDEFWQDFSISPAARGFHHNYLGGLLKHTVGLMRIARYILKQEENPFQAVIKLIQVVEKAYKQEIWDNFTAEGRTERPIWQDTIDHLYQMLIGMMEYKEAEPHYDALMTSILLHDIGKILEYDFAGKGFHAFEYLYPTADRASLQERKQMGIKMDELGVMVGHIPYGALLFTKVIEQKKIELSLEEVHLVSHCILCHHGLPEWGSVVKKPQTIEGYLIHIVDYLDSRYENTETVK